MQRLPLRNLCCLAVTVCRFRCPLTNRAAAITCADPMHAPHPYPSAIPSPLLPDRVPFNKIRPHRLVHRAPPP